MNSIEDFLARLERVTKTGDEWKASCPCTGHGKGGGDRNPSLSVALASGPDGRGGDTIPKVVVHCHAGCSAESVVSALGMEMRDLFLSPHGPPERRAGPRKQAGTGKVYPTPDAAIAAACRGLGAPSFQWGYTDESGELMGYVLRFDPSTGKTYRPVSKCPGGWRCKAMSAPRPLYGLTFLPDAEQVFVTEGEKAADALAALGLVATTCAGGSHAAKHTDWTPLAGKQVVIFPDNDEPGRGYGEDVAELLRGLDPRPTVRFMDTGPAGLALPDKGDDAVEYIERLRADGLDAASIRADLEGRVPDLRMDDCEAPTRPEMIPNWRPFPVDVLPNIVADYVKAGADGIDCDPVLVAVPLLTAIAAAIGTTRKIDVNGQWSEYPILWTCVVAESGAGDRHESRTPCARHAKEARRIHSEAGNTLQGPGL